jgi:hypothetical protein
MKIFAKVLLCIVFISTFGIGLKCAEVEYYNEGGGCWRTPESSECAEDGSVGVDVPDKDPGGAAAESGRSEDEQPVEYSSQELKQKLFENARKRSSEKINKEFRDLVLVIEAQLPDFVNEWFVDQSNAKRGGCKISRSRGRVKKQANIVMVLAERGRIQSIQFLIEIELLQKNFFRENDVLFFAIKGFLNYFSPQHVHVCDLCNSRRIDSCCCFADVVAMVIGYDWLGQEINQIMNDLCSSYPKKHECRITEYARFIEVKMLHQFCTLGFDTNADLEEDGEVRYHLKALKLAGVPDSRVVCDPAHISVLPQEAAVSAECSVEPTAHPVVPVQYSIPSSAMIYGDWRMQCVPPYFTLPQWAPMIPGVPMPINYSNQVMAALEVPDCVPKEKWVMPTDLSFNINKHGYSSQGCLERDNEMFCNGVRCELDFGCCTLDDFLRFEVCNFDSVLHLAAFRCRLEIVRFLLFELNANSGMYKQKLNLKSSTPFYRAISGFIIRLKRCDDSMIVDCAEIIALLLGCDKKDSDELLQSVYEILNAFRWQEGMNNVVEIKKLAKQMLSELLGWRGIALDLKTFATIEFEFACLSGM